jgi:hypothetical protein
MALQNAFSHTPKGAINGSIPWRAVNNALSTSNNPVLGLNDHESFQEFSDRFDQDPTLQKIVDRFDDRGLVIKTGEEEPNIATNEPSTGAMEKRAKSATKRAFS